MRGCWNWEPDNRPAFEEIHYAMENMFQESSITEEVERQLKSFASASNTPNAVPTPQLPSKKPRHQGQSSTSTSRNKAEHQAQVSVFI